MSSIITGIEQQPAMNTNNNVHIRLSPKPDIIVAINPITKLKYTKNVIKFMFSPSPSLVSNNEELIAVYRV